MTILKYANDGFVFRRVETPSVFREYELPECDLTFNHKQKRQMAELTHLANAHGTYVKTSYYRVG